MSAGVLDAAPTRGGRQRLRAALSATRQTALSAGKAAIKAAKAAARPARKQLADHVYTIIGIGLFDSAMFVHSLFTGLLVSGISFVVFEWKVSDE